jgi:O-antigen/teichoic acid export membrane protein
MNYIAGMTLFLLGAIIATFAAGNSAAAWIMLGALAVGWAVLAVYILGIQRGKRHNDL